MKMTMGGEDRATHLSRAGDHALHIVGISRTVDMRMVPSVGLIHAPP